jgi:hypothetical protein
VQFQISLINGKRAVITSLGGVAGKRRSFVKISREFTGAFMKSGIFIATAN